MKKLFLIILFIISISLNGFTQNPETRQGGDDIGTATIINALPYSDNGTTTGYTNDYFGDCGMPGDNNKANDVVYSYSPSVDELVNISLCGSAFNTILYVFENAANNIPAGWCNDDYSSCSPSSQLDNLYFTSGNTYYIVVDGHKANSGDYVINITASAPPPEFEIRLTENGTTGLMDVEMREINGNINITTSTQIEDIDFAVKWNPGTDYDYSTDVTIVCTDYNIADKNDPYSIYYVDDNFGNVIYYLRVFTVSGSPFNSPENWTTGNWITIASLRAREIVYDVSGTLTVITSDASGWEYEIIPTGDHVATDEADPIIEIGGTRYDNTVNGLVTGYQMPTIVDFTWQGGDNTSPYDGNSWNNVNNWRNMCDNIETHLPGPLSNCIIPFGRSQYPKYSRPTDGTLYYAWCKTLTIENGGEVNWERSGGWTDLMAWDNIEVNTGGGMTLNQESIFIASNLWTSANSINGSVSETHVDSYFRSVENLNINNTNSFSALGWLTVNGNTTINAPQAMRIEADASGVGSFLNTGTVSYSNGGSAIVETYMQGTGAPSGSSYMHFAGPAVKDISYTTQTGVRLEQFNMTTLDTYSYEWDPSVNYSTDNPWLNVWPFEYNVPVADGLAITNWVAGTGTMEMEGTLVVETFTDYTVNYYGNNAEEWELVSNPYPTAISFSDFYTYNSSLIYDKFRIYLGTGNNWYDYVSGSGDPEIQVGQGFMVQVRPGASGQLIFNTAIRDHNDVAFRSPDQSNFKVAQVKSIPIERQDLNKNQTAALKKAENSLANDINIENFIRKPRELYVERGLIPNLLRIKVQGGDYHYEDITNIRFLEEATTGYDLEFEMKKWNSNNTDATMIRSIAEDGTKLSTNALPLESLNHDMVSVPLHFQCGYDGTYTFTFSGEETFDLSTEIWLEDKLENNLWYSISETNQVYTFTGSPTDQEDRFIVHFFGSTGVENNTAGAKNNINIYSSGNDVYVISDSEETIRDIAIYNLLGSKITQTTATAKDINKLTIHSSTGYYVVRVLTDKNVYSEKVFIMK